MKKYDWKKLAYVVEYFDRIRLANFAKLDIIADGVNLKYGKEWLPFKGVDLSILGRNTPVTFEKAAALAEKASQKITQNSTI